MTTDGNAVIGYGIFESAEDDSLFVGEWTAEDQRAHNIEPSNFFPDLGSAERALAETKAKAVSQ